MSVIFERDIVKFSLVGVCFLLVLFSRRDALHKKDHLFLLLAMSATLIADLFLVLFHIYPVGVFVFWGAHVFYSLRFAGKKVWPFFLAALPLSIIILITTSDVLTAAASGYAALFVISYTTAILAIKRKKYPTPNIMLIGVGMTFFLICDIFVMLANLSHIGHGSAALSNFAFDAIWMFYAPAKVCLALSAIRFERSPILSPEAKMPQQDSG